MQACNTKGTPLHLYNPAFYLTHSPWASDKIHIGFPISRHLGHLQGFGGVLHELVDFLAALRLGHHASADAKHGNIWQHLATSSTAFTDAAPALPSNKGQDNEKTIEKACAFPSKNSLGQLTCLKTANSSRFISPILDQGAHAHALLVLEIKLIQCHGLGAFGTRDDWLLAPLRQNAGDGAEVTSDA